MNNNSFVNITTTEPASMEPLAGTPTLQKNNSANIFGKTVPVNLDQHAGVFTQLPKPQQTTSKFQQQPTPCPFVLNNELGSTLEVVFLNSTNGQTFFNFFAVLIFKTFEIFRPTFFFLFFSPLVLFLFL